MMHDGWGWGLMGGWMWLFWLLVLLGIVAIVVWIARAGSRSAAGTPPQQTPQQTPEELLRERYARGEIDEVEYRRRSDELQH